MRENTTEVVVGAAVLAAALGFLWFIVSATGLSGGTAGMELKANFRSAEGVSVGTDIRLAGVSVGTVSQLDLNGETYRAEAVFSIDEGIAIPDDSAAVVASEGLLGGTFVELVPGGSFEMFADGGLIQDTQGAVSLIQLLMKFVGGEEA
ncbi:phospholipid/cholesterol/gamma-HCH transport system substrate-binding protein [Octadecabacter temperatus]|uniref:Putative phospholipid ABC transporter-binding protein MlaD n=1 Tax=Octadecabacter temperatus TaxID=1458307 RepID=A0A0K0Y486_9RHOB|nr:outer membrane lipid asymmetry maintenance protein MlaD [Octadecabacter temperatus]AKS45730.1 putative phospholipid ABC transporter-binding protein MlaD [Octadecabacter temperatus]SIN99263.1 phospholipid/cholesterol/gamma-HCH transport system substrate-binding protein [Octadecabacter temperatus]